MHKPHKVPEAALVLRSSLYPTLEDLNRTLREQYNDDLSSFTLQGLHKSFIAPSASPSLLESASNGHDVSEDAVGEERSLGGGRQGVQGGEGEEGDVAENGTNSSRAITHVSSSSSYENGANSSRAISAEGVKGCLAGKHLPVDHGTHEESTPQSTLSTPHETPRHRLPSGGERGVGGGARGGALEWHLGEGVQGAGARWEWEGDGRGRGGCMSEQQEVCVPRKTEVVGAWVGEAWKVGVGGEGREGFVTRVAGEGGERGTGLQDSGVGDGREGCGAEEGLEEEGGGVKGVGVGLALVAWIPQGLAAVLNKVKFSLGLVASRLGLGFRLRVWA